MLNPEAGDTHAGGGVRERMIRERWREAQTGRHGAKNKRKNGLFSVPNSGTIQGSYGRTRGVGVRTRGSSRPPPASESFG